MPPMEPGWVVCPGGAAVEVGLALPLLLQAARAVTPAIARASPPRRFLLSITAPHFLRRSRMWVGSEVIRVAPFVSQVAGDPL
jgi:hypothetical protein